MSATEEKIVSTEKTGSPLAHDMESGSIEKAPSSTEGTTEKINSDDVDEALNFLGTGEHMVFTDEQNNKLLTKIDFHILPIMGLLYMLQFLDKTTISYASVMNIITDTNLVGTQYNWLGSAFYVGYLAAEYPVNLALQRLPLAKFLSSQIVIWGAILMFHALCKEFASLMAVRILLGMFEASITPAFILIVSQWWQKEEHGLRTGIWFCCNGFGQILGAVVSYGIAVGIKNNGYTALAGWQIMFLFTGSLTVLCGILFYFIVPDSPATAWFLSREEKVMALERIRGNQQGVGNKHFKKYQIYAALKDPFTWLLFTFSICTNIPNGALTNFKNIILQGFGLSKELSLLYGAPSGAVQVIATTTICYMADKTRQRIYWSIFALSIPILGFILMVTLPQDNLGGNLAAFYITSTASTAFTLVLSMISSNVAGQSKKSVVNAINLIGYCVGNLIGPQIISLENAPRYLAAKTIICGLYGVAVVLLLMMRFLALYRNKVKDRKLAELGPDHVKVQNQEFMDLTDNENLYFRYVI